jgi:hypothetical protein
VYVHLLLAFSSSTFVLVEAQEAECVEMDENGTVLREAFWVKRGDIFYIPPFHTLRFVSGTGAVRGFRTFSFEVFCREDLCKGNTNNGIKPMF